MGLMKSFGKINKGIFGGGYLRDALQSDFIRGEGSGRERGQKAALIQGGLETNRAYGNQAMQELVKGLGARVGGYDQAIAKTSGISRAARREAKGQATEAAGTLASRYGAGGKFGTTALDNAMQGLRSSLTRDLEGIDAYFAGLFSELATGRGETEAAGRTDIANLNLKRAGMENEFLDMLLGNVKPSKGGIAAELGAAIGSAYGGPAGGAVGGSIGQAFERT